MQPFVLFIEDDTDDQDLFKEYLDQLRFSAYAFVADAKSALAFLQAREEGSMPTLIVTDYFLPGTSGTEFVQMIKAYPGFAKIHVVLYTGTVTDDLRTEGKAIGVQEVLQKPTDVEGLGYMIARIIELARKDATTSAELDGVA